MREGKEERERELESKLKKEWYLFLITTVSSGKKKKEQINNDFINLLCLIHQNALDVCT